MTRIIVRGGVALVALAACGAGERATSPSSATQIDQGAPASIGACQSNQGTTILFFTMEYNCGDAIRIVAEPGTPEPQLTQINNAIAVAVTRWNALGGGTNGIPVFSTSSGNKTITVSWNTESVSGVVCGISSGPTIDLWRWASVTTPNACIPATSMSSASAAGALLVHEIAHSFGMANEWHRPAVYLGSSQAVMGHCAVAIGLSTQNYPTGFLCQHDIEFTYGLFGLRSLPDLSKHIITGLDGIPDVLRLATGSTTQLTVTNAVLARANGTLCDTGLETSACTATAPTPNISWSASPPSVVTVSGAGATATVTTYGLSQAGTVVLTPSSGAYNIATYTTGTQKTIIVAAPATITVNAGNGQSATAGSAVAVAPSVIVKDASNQPLQSATVSFAASGNGSVAPLTVKTNAAGIATVTSWTLSTTAGGNTLTATVAGLTPQVLTATGTAGPASLATVSAGNNQSAPVGTPVAVAPAIRVTDQYGNGVAGRGVTFAIASGGGSVTGASQTTNASGVATVGSWTLGPTVGSQTLSATVSGSGVSPNPVLFTATATTPPPIGTPGNFHEVSRSCYVQGGKTYVNYTVNWTRGEFSSGSGYQILESTSPDTLSAAVIKAGPSGTTTAVLGAYTVNATPNNRYWWIRHTLSGGATGPLAAFNANPKNVAEGCVQ